MISPKSFVLDQVECFPESVGTLLCLSKNIMVSEIGSIALPPCTIAVSVTFELSLFYIICSSVLCVGLTKYSLQASRVHMAVTIPSANTIIENSIDKQSNYVNEFAENTQL